MKPTPQEIYAAAHDHAEAWQGEGGYCQCTPSDAKRCGYAPVSLAFKAGAWWMATHLSTKPQIAPNVTGEGASRHPAAEPHWIHMAANEIYDSVMAHPPQSWEDGIIGGYVAIILKHCPWMAGCEHGRVPTIEQLMDWNKRQAKMIVDGAKEVQLLKANIRLIVEQAKKESDEHLTREELHTLMVGQYPAMEKELSEMHNLLLKKNEIIRKLTS